LALIILYMPHPKTNTLAVAITKADAPPLGRLRFVRTVG